MLTDLKRKSIDLLKDLISIQSYSRQEDKTAERIGEYLTSEGLAFQRVGNNILAGLDTKDLSKPILLLNSHHDTVKPNQGYSRDPFAPTVSDDKLFGLGSNDAGASLVGLIASYVHFQNQDLPLHLALVASAEEEISGKGGIESLINKMPNIWAAIVGEPTLMKAATAEKGLLVIDGLAQGKAGHAAREEGINAISIAVKDIRRVNECRFERISNYLGPIKKTVTIIKAGNQHNVVPDQCSFTIDVRVTDEYSHQEILDTLQAQCTSTLTPRSMRLKSSGLDKDHLFWQVFETLDIETYGSPTLSDQALMPWPSIKMGIGDSARSHMADEFVYLKEIDLGISRYIDFIHTASELLLKKT